eukprot:5276218-Alexandrium_andersonii.AAC.1
MGAEVQHRLTPQRHKGTFQLAPHLGGTREAARESSNDGRCPTGRNRAPRGSPHPPHHPNTWEEVSRQST